MGQDNSSQTGKAQWQKTSGFAADSKMVHIIVPETKVDDWDREAEEEGFDNRSDYLRTLIAEARADRLTDAPTSQEAEYRIQELEAEVKRLREELEQNRQRHSGRPEIDDFDFLEQFLSSQYKQLNEIIQDIMESGVLDDLIRKRVENQLYFLASQDTVEYERGWGWRLAQEGGA